MAKLNLLLLAVLVAAPLAACSPQIRVPERVEIPVAVACVDPDRRRPAPLEAMRPEGEIRTLGDYQVIPRLRVDRLKLIQHVERLEAIVDGCARAAPPRKP